MFCRRTLVGRGKRKTKKNDPRERTHQLAREARGRAERPVAEEKVLAHDGDLPLDARQAVAREVEAERGGGHD